MRYHFRLVEDSFEKRIDTALDNAFKMVSASAVDATLQFLVRDGIISTDQRSMYLTDILTRFERLRREDQS